MVTANSEAIRKLETQSSRSGFQQDRSFAHGHHQDRPPRFQKLDFPKYDGKGDLLIFINKCDSYFHQQRIVEEEKVWMASFNLDDAAQMWYIHVQKEQGTPSWKRFTELLNTRFGPHLRSNPLGELAACRRTSSVADYQEQFLQLLARAGTLTEPQQVQLFCAGLQEPLSIDVQIQNPQTLEVAMSLARAFEHREQVVAQAAQAARPVHRGILPTPTLSAPR
jgi:hypothetical protein